MSRRPDCAGRVLHQYTVQVLGSAPGRGPLKPAQRQVFLPPDDARLTAGAEYVALLWRDDYTTDDLVLPVVLGRLGPTTGELRSLPVANALTVLGAWARER
ncbi:MAG: hypothetical protein AB7P22_13820 [Vicinamibacterales bacterium]